MKTLEFQLDTETIKKILQGLEVSYHSDEIKVTLYPPQRGVFITKEELAELGWKLKAKGAAHILDEVIQRKFTR